MIFFADEMEPGSLHDHIEAYSVKFWFTNEEGYRETKTLTMFIEHGDKWNKIEKTLSSRFKKPEIVSVKYQ